MATIPSIARPRQVSDFSGLARSIWKVFKLRSSEASFVVRGFYPSRPAKREHLETIGRTFIRGYNAALEAQSASDPRQFVDTVGAELRGFAAEGASMGVAIRSSLSLSQTWLESAIGSFESDFDYLAHVGIGWAMARVPWRARKYRSLLDPIHHWLTDDGRGFHDTYFNHKKVLAGWRRKLTGYSAGPYDQGVGRALWFVAGGEVADAAVLIEALPEERHSDLWSGLGLAMTYAGPADGDEITRAFATAGIHRSHFAQGVAFACEARVKARHVPAYTDLAAWSVWGVSAQALSRLVRDARAQLQDVEGDVPRYELWRRSVAASLSSATG
jgi:hypothetical protein